MILWEDWDFEYLAEFYMKEKIEDVLYEKLALDILNITSNEIELNV